MSTSYSLPRVRSGWRLGNADHLVVWQRPARPEWMDEETYATIPETLTVRELKVRVDVPGFRVRELVVVSALAAVSGVWTLASVADAPTLSLHAKAQHYGITWSPVGHRPNRVEPRAIKRRPKAHKLLNRPRAEARTRLLAAHGACP